MKKIIVTVIIITFTLSGYSQSFFSDLIRFNNGGMFSLQWNVGMPTGDMKDFTSKTSFSGINLDFKHCYKNGIILGGRTGWQYFSEDMGLKNIKEGTTSSYTEQINKINIFPILATADYMYMNDILIPYIGLGIGGYIINTSTYENNVKQSSDGSFNFGLSPEIGLTMPFIISNLGMNVNTKYNYAFGAGSSSGLGWFEFNIGLSFMY